MAMKRILLLLIGMAGVGLSAGNAVAGGQTRLTDPRQVKNTVFWKQLYPDGGQTLYCNRAFKAKSILIDADYIYRPDQIADFLKCPSLHACKKKPEFQRMMSDLHNMFPALKMVIRDRRNSLFGTVPGNEYKFEDCNYKTTFQETEPRDTAKGDIARAMLYMHTEYGLPLPGRQDLMRQWNDIDPVDASERKRNDLIEQIQGNRNRFIDHPEEVEALFKF